MLASRADIELQALWATCALRGAPSSRTAPLNAAVAIFETHNIIELSGACLKDDRVL